MDLNISLAISFTDFILGTKLQPNEAHLIIQLTVAQLHWDPRNLRGVWFRGPVVLFIIYVLYTNLCYTSELSEFLRGTLTAQRYMNKQS